MNIYNSESLPETHRTNSKGILNSLSLGNSFEDIRRVYAFEKTKLGKGGFSTVRKAVLRHDGVQYYAIKTITKSNNNKLLKTELDIIRELNHPNIAFFFESYQNEAEFHLVLEHCGGGTLKTLIEEHDGLNEEGAQHLMFQMLLAINYLHNRGVVHRDLNLENFLVSTHKGDVNEKVQVKLIDFGLSIRITQGEVLKDRIGSKYFVAPEVLGKKGYDHRADYWSLGVIMYVML